MSSESEVFRGMQINIYPEYDSIEVMVDEKNFHDNISGIFSINNVVEYVLHRSNKYLIYNKLDHHYEVDPKLYSYINDQIFRQLKAAGIRRVIFIIGEKSYLESYQHLNPETSYMLGFTSRNDALGWIEKDRLKQAVY